MLRLEVGKQGVDGLNVDSRLNGIISGHGACDYRKSLDGNQKCLKVFVGLLALSGESQFFRRQQKFVHVALEIRNGC